MNLYQVEIEMLSIAYVSVEAKDEQDARDRAIGGEREVGQAFPPSIEKISVRLQEEHEE